MLKQYVTAAVQLHYSPDRAFGSADLQGYLVSGKLLEEAVHVQIQGSIVVTGLDKSVFYLGVLLLSLEIIGRDCGLDIV